MMSCEQICGKHLHLEDNRKNITEKIQILQTNSPHCHIFHGKNTFKVRSINATDITTSSCGHNPWYLIRAIKSSRKQLNILLLNTIVWGVEIGQGMKLQKSGEEIGQDKIATLIMNKINSIFEDPTQYEEIQVFH